jgi:hypothetical protein
VAAAASLAAVAGQAAQAPDAHDRALSATLDANVAAFRDISTTSFGASVTRTLHGCVPLEKGIASNAKNAGTAFAGLLTAALELALPLTVDLADRYRPELVRLQTVLATMNPDSSLFAQWRSAETRSVTFILKFDNHGRLVDPCAAALYMQGLAKASKSARAAELAQFPQKVGLSLGQYEALAPALYSNSDPADILSGLAPRMKAFFRAAGLSSNDAAVLSSSE